MTKRLSSHKLTIETGRWSRILREQRLCPCGAIQTEVVICQCPLSEHVRSRCVTIPFTSIADCFDSPEVDLVCRVRRLIYDKFSVTLAFEEFFSVASDS